ncbi:MULTISPECIES: hypothetical protein [Hyphobacterium]|uniref:Uncharacterized protein n=1 Tax=Hyphobacterium vulgare TaxID=1736751 RepID=A0ABV6ZZI3_9PROT
MLASLALLALALDTQDAQDAQAPITPPAQEEISAEARAAAYAYAEQIADFMQSVIAQEAGGRYVLTGTDTLATELAEQFAVVMTYGDAPAGEYNMEMRATFFSVPDGATPEGMYCAEGVPSTMVDQPVEDSAGNTLRFRGCWGGEQDAETGRLTGGVIYQLDSGGHYALYQGLIDGPEEEGLRERLSLLEPAIGVMVAHTVFVPGSE